MQQDALNICMNQYAANTVALHNFALHALCIYCTRQLKDVLHRYPDWCMDFKCFKNMDFKNMLHQPELRYSDRINRV